jgi:hypothetical protein
MKLLKARFFLVALLVLQLRPALSQAPNTNTAQSTRQQFTAINQKILVMAKDFPAGKYDFKLKPEMRTFAAVLIHITSGTVYAAKAGRGEKADWNELDPKDYKTKAAVVALMEKSIADAEATLKNVPDESFVKSIEPWMSVTEHSAEHYGLLVAYFRANGIVPPDSRPQPGK